MARKLRNLRIDEVSLVDRGANQEAHIKLFKRDTGGSMADDAKIKELEQQLAAAKAAEATAKADLDKLKVDTTLSSDTATLKRQLDASQVELTKQRADLQKQLEDAQKETETARAEVAKIQKQRRRETFIKWVSELRDLPGAPVDDFAEILDNIEAGMKAVAPEKAEKQFAKLQMLLKSWNEIAKKSGLFQEFGRSGSVPSLKGADAVLEHMAKERAAADKIPHAQAYAKVLQENPDIYARYRAEKGA